MTKPKAAKAGARRRWITWLVLGPIGLVLLIQLYFFVQVCWYVWFNPSMTSMMSAQLDVLRETNPKAQLQQQWVPYARISNHLKRAVITQQLAKNLFLSGSRSYLRKGQEMIIAFMLETVMGKERILEIYLNVVEYGRGIFGAEAAARHYYRSTAASLNTAQAAKLAVMLPNPRFYDKHRDSNYLARRTSLILNRMNSADLP
jgi:monofunctional biosynthetic peptidoglycan transglycosylase